MGRARCCASAWKYLQVIENKGKNVLFAMACRILFSHSDRVRCLVLSNTFLTTVWNDQSHDWQASLGEGCDLPRFMRWRLT